MLLRFDPFRDLDRLTEQLAAPATAPHLAMDAVKRGDSVEIRFDLPGFDPGTVDLEVDRNVLTLTAERHWEPGEGDEVLANERRYGRFTRQLLLGDQLDGGAVQADFRDGVLVVTIPVAESAKPRKVAIGGTSSGTTIDVSESDNRRELSESKS